MNGIISANHKTDDLLILATNRTCTFWKLFLILTCIVHENRELHIKWNNNELIAPHNAALRTMPVNLSPLSAQIENFMFNRQSEWRNFRFITQTLNVNHPALYWDNALTPHYSWRFFKFQFRTDRMYSLFKLLALKCYFKNTVNFSACRQWEWQVTSA